MTLTPQLRTLYRQSMRLAHRYPFRRGEEDEIFRATLVDIIRREFQLGEADPLRAENGLYQLQCASRGDTALHNMIFALGSGFGNKVYQRAVVNAILTGSAPQTEGQPSLL